LSAKPEEKKIRKRERPAPASPQKGKTGTRGKEYLLIGEVSLFGCQKRRNGISEKRDRIRKGGEKETKLVTTCCTSRREEGEGGSGVLKGRENQ